MRLMLWVALLCAAALGLAAWVVPRTEWADKAVPTPAKGDAAVNPLYAAQALLRELRATVVQRESLDTLPPPSARLVLVSRHWDLLPQRAEKLHDWVMGGGHLVIPSTMADHDALDDWLPVARSSCKARPASDATTPEKPATRPSAPSAPAKSAQDRRANDEDCHTVSQPTPLAQGAPASLKVCGGWLDRPLVIKTGRGPSRWSLDGPQGTEALRVPVGSGSVTVVNGWQMFDNRDVLRADNALLTVAALQAGTGAVIWFVSEESRPPLLGWLWQRGWPALVLAALALMLALWRAAVRTEPAGRPEGRQRRSMAEQVRGTGRFLQRHGSAALHAAQARALDEAARRQLRGFAQLDAAGQASAIAAATGVNAAALARALQLGAPAGALALMETARRRLTAMPASASPVAPRPDSSSDT